MCKAYEDYEKRLDATFMLHEALASLADVRTKLEDPDAEFSSEDIERCDLCLEDVVSSTCGSVFTFENEPAEYFGLAWHRALLFNKKYSSLFGKVPVGFSGSEFVHSGSRGDIVQKYNDTKAWLATVRSMVQDRVCTTQLYA